MAASTVAYTDTTGNKDYLGMIASQIGKRLKQASDMASDERAYAEKQAEKNNTSLAEAGIGRGHFFKRALGSRFGGDKIARTRGRLGAQGPGTDPTKNYKQRFRGGFDYNYSEQINQVTRDVGGAIVPMSSALSVGLRGVEGGLVQVSQSVSALAVSMTGLAKTQDDMAREVMMMGAFMRAFMEYMRRQQQRSSARSEERLLEGGRRSLGGRGGPINITPGKGGPGMGGPSGGGLLKAGDTIQTAAKLGSNVKGISGAADLVGDVAGSGARSLARAGVKAPLTASRMAGNFVKKYSGSMSSKVAAKTGVKGVDAVIDAGRQIAKKPIVKSLKPGVTMLTNVGAKEVTTAAKTFDALDMAADAAKADAFAKEMAKLGLEDDLVAKLASGAGDVKVPQKAGARFFEALRTGLIDGTRRTTEQALAASRFLLGDAQYKRLLKGADKPIGKALEGTVTDGLLKGMGKNAGKMAGKGVLKSVLKKIPIIAGIAGIGFGIQRALEGDFLGAGLEITSGLLGATGVGSGLSFGIDGFLLARDLGMMPMAKGGLLTGKRPVNALMGEAGPEIVTPLNEETFEKFGKGILDAQKRNKSDFIALHKAPVEKAIDGTLAKKSWWDSLKGFFGGGNGGGGGDNPQGGFNLFDPSTWFGGGSTQPQTPMLTPPPPVTTGVTGSTAERNLAAFLSTLEATGDQNSMDALQVMLNRTALSKSGKAYTWAGNSLFEQITAREQFSPYSAAIFGTSADPAAAAKYGNILSGSPEERRSKLLEIASGPDALNNLQTLFKGGNAASASRILADLQSDGALAKESRRYIQGRTSFRGYRSGSGDLNRGRGGNFFFNNQGTTGLIDNISPLSNLQSLNASGDQANALNRNSMFTSMLGGGMMMPTTVINNYTAAAPTTGSGDSSFGAAFESSGFSPFVNFYSLAAKS